MFKASRATISLIALVLGAPVNAQLVPLSEGGARSVALGRAGTALPGDAWGHHNPAAWSVVDRGEVALFASQAHGLSEMRVVAGAVTYPLPLGVVAVQARRYGFEDFSETVLGAGFGRPLPLTPTRSLRLGLALRYTHVRIPDFLSRGALGVSIGMQAELIPGLDLGAHFFNLNQAQLSDLDPLESRIDIGLAYRVHPRTLALLAASKDVHYPLSIRGGIEVQPVDVLFARAGFTTEPSRMSLGIGIATGRLRADVAAEHHHALGLTPAFEVGIQW